MQIAFARRLDAIAWRNCCGASRKAKPLRVKKQGNWKECRQARKQKVAESPPVTYAVRNRNRGTEDSFHFAYCVEISCLQFGLNPRVIIL